MNEGTISSCSHRRQSARKGSWAAGSDASVPWRGCRVGTEAESSMVQQGGHRLPISQVRLQSPAPPPQIRQRPSIRAPPCGPQAPCPLAVSSQSARTLAWPPSTPPSIAGPELLRKHGQCVCERVHLWGVSACADTCTCVVHVQVGLCLCIFLRGRH